MRILLAFVLALLLIIELLFLYKQRVGDIRPAVLPEKTGDSPSVPLSVPEGYSIGTFASNLGNVRDLEFSTDGTLLVSETANGKIHALPDRDKDGKADEVKTVIQNLNNPHGLAFFNDKLYVAEETRVVRYNFDETKLEATLDKVLFNIPPGVRHSTRTIDFDKTGKMFVSVGSSCDVCFEREPWHGAVLVSDSEGNNPRIFAKGLRNTVFITVHPETGELWGTEMGRDFLGDNLPPDEINILKEGRDYGWPICFGDQVPDKQFRSSTTVEDCKKTEPPAYSIQAHSAPLGLVFTSQGDLLVALHGSWNRSTPVGYKIARLDVEGNRVVEEEDFITGFLQGSQALGRPVDLIFDKAGSLYISDDKIGAVYKVVKKLQN